MKTLEMLFKAEHDGNTYKNDDLHYSKEKGFHYGDGKPWEGRAFPKLNDLIHDEGELSDNWELVDTTISFQEMCELAFSGKHTKFKDASNGCPIHYIREDFGVDGFYWVYESEEPSIVPISKSIVNRRYKKV